MFNKTEDVMLLGLEIGASDSYVFETVCYSKLSSWERWCSQKTIQTLKHAATEHKDQGRKLQNRLGDAIFKSPITHVSLNLLKIQTMNLSALALS